LQKAPVIILRAKAAMKNHLRFFMAFDYIPLNL